jgi:dTMP kinase
VKDKSFIVVEGLDGSGKTTISNAIVRTLGGSYLYSLSPLFEPIKTAIENQGDPLLRFLYYINSLVALQDDIQKTLRQGHLVLDRYIDSTIIYHKALGVDTSVLDISKLRLRKPDFIFVLLVPRQERLKRIQNRGNTTEHRLHTLDDVSARLESLFHNHSNFCFPETTHFLDNDDQHKLLSRILKIIGSKRGDKTND